MSDTQLAVGTLSGSRSPVATGAGHTLDLGGLTVSGSLTVIQGDARFGASSGGGGRGAPGLTGSITTIPDGSALIRAGSANITVVTSSVPSGDGDNRWYEIVTIDSSGAGTPGGDNTQVQFNDSSAFGGDANFTYDGAGTATLLVGLEVGHASDTSLTRSSAGVLAVEGAVVYSAGGTDIPVSDGGTGASSLTDGGILLGSGTDAITAMAVLSDGEMIVGDGTTDPVAESGATLRTSIGVGTSDSPQFAGLTVESSVSNMPLVILKNETNDALGARLRFVKDKGAAGADGDDAGSIEWIGDDAAETLTPLAKILVEVSEADDTDEAGKMSLFVAESDGTTTTLTAGLVLEGEHATDGQVDVTIGAGASSTTTIAGDVDVTGDAHMGNVTRIAGAEITMTSIAVGSTASDLLELGTDGFGEGDVAGVSGTVCLYQLGGTDVDASQKTFSFVAQMTATGSGGGDAALTYLEASTEGSSFIQTRLDNLDLKAAIDSNTNKWVLQVVNKEPDVGGSATGAFKAVVAVDIIARGSAS